MCGDQREGLLLTYYRSFGAIFILPLACLFIVETDEGNGEVGHLNLAGFYFMTFTSIITGSPATRLPIPAKKPNLVGEPGGIGG